MKVFNTIQSGFSVIKRYHYKLVLVIAIMWTFLDLVYWVYFMQLPPEVRHDSTYVILTTGSIILRTLIVFIMSFVMGYMIVFKLRQRFRDIPLLLNILVKTGVLLITSFVMNILLHITYSVLILHLTVNEGLYRFFIDSRSALWLLEHSVGWLIVFLFTLVLIEINEKYSPGVFLDILLGRYIHPQVEKRIIVFLDLINATPTAERLDNKQYFRFLRDFIYYISLGILEYDGRIYQYVGDEVVVSWKYDQKNIRKCILALITARKLLQRNANHFQKRYGVFPEFKAGIHIGEVTMGEIGLIKKDIAMSGDTMNTTARIRTACTELNYNFIASKEFVDGIPPTWEVKDLGEYDLKGKSIGIELFALKL